MDFSITTTAQDYIYRRYPRATVYEKEKYVKDWINKVEVSKKILTDFEKRIGSLKGMRVIDAGCGNGGMSIALAEMGAQTEGVEVEQELYDISCKHAAAYASPAHFTLYDGTILPFTSDSFDAGISVSVLEHTTDPVQYLQELLRVMRPEGKLYLSFPNRLWPKETHTGLWFLTYLPRALMPAMIALFKKNPIEDNSLHFYTYWDMKRMLKDATSDGYQWDIIPEYGESQSFVKKVIKNILGVFGLSHRMFLAHVSVILVKRHEKN